MTFMTYAKGRANFQLPSALLCPAMTFTRSEAQGALPQPEVRMPRGPHLILHDLEPLPRACGGLCLSPGWGL